MFAVATMVFFKNRTLGTVMYMLAIMTGFGRVMAGVHWPSDIIGGAILGILVALAIHALAKKFAKN